MVFGLSLAGLGGAKKGPADPPPSNPKGQPSNQKGDTSARGQKDQGGRDGGATRGALTVNEFVARTKRCRERGLEPTKPELIAYARYLGIDPITDGDLMWIADEALNSPLPSEWTEHHDSADRVFYYNVQTHASSWTHPLEQLHRDTYKSMVHFRNGDLSKEDQLVEFDKMKRKVEDAEREAHKELQSWSEHLDEQGTKFYYNREQQRSVWTDPRPARCHSLYLQMKALRVLSKHCGQAITTKAGNSILESIGEDSVRDKLRIQQRLCMAMGPAEGPGKSSKQADQTAGAASDAEQQEREKRKRKKKAEAEAKETAAEQPKPKVVHDLTDEPESDDDARPDPRSVLKPLATVETKKSSRHDAHDEARLDPLRTGDRGDRGDRADRDRSNADRLPSLGGVSRLDALMGGGRLPTPPGDGLSSQGRARVRAGIKLEPLRGGM